MAGLLQRCEVEGSESVSAEPSEEVEITKRPATKTKASLKKKEEDADITALGVCKGNDEDEGDNDEGSLGQTVMRMAPRNVLAVGKPNIPVTRKTRRKRKKEAQEIQDWKETEWQ